MEAFNHGLPLPVMGDYDEQTDRAYAHKLWAALLKSDEARARARARGASFDVQERAARVAWRIADRASWSDFYDDGATLRSQNSRVEASNRQHRKCCEELQREILDCEHKAALALRATIKAVAAQDKTRAFKAHKRAGLAASQAACKKEKLWDLRRPMELEEIKNDSQVRAILNNRMKEVADAVANAQRSWVAADNLHSMLYEQRQAPRAVHTLRMLYGSP